MLGFLRAPYQAKGLASRRIRVNTIAVNTIDPGMMETPGHSNEDEFDQKIDLG